ncbi:MAG TPA: site-2 protease family protein [Gemmataceae bacterium]|nr:site-2 protease family protein [Gemmataceae bacterium]
MNPEAPTTDLERRKHVRLRLRQDLNIAPQKYEGRTYWVVKDPVSMRYYRFKEQEHFLLQFMDGEHTLDEAQKEYEQRFRPERLKLEDLEHFGQQLLTAGLAQNESPRAGKQLYDRRKKRLRSEWMQALTNILYIKIPIFDPDKLLTKMMPYCGWVFSPTALVLAHLYFLGALLFVGMHFEPFYDKLPRYQEFFTFGNLGWMWLALGIVKVIHEFGHGLSCRKYGGEVHEMGALFLCLSPCLYCNVSDAWTLPNKWKRIVISYAGIYIELFIAATATFVWWYTPSHPFINNLALCLMVVCSVSTVVFNANPLMRYDGYYVMADWMEIPNLRDRSNRFLKNTVLEHCLGVEVQPETYMATNRKVLFIAYAVVSYVYRWVVTYSILIFMSNFLKPYKLEVVSKMLALAALGSMVGWPLWRLGKNLHRRGRLPDMKTGRVVISGTVVGVLLVAFFTVPLPVSRVRQTGLVLMQDSAETPVLLREDGRLDELKVVNGEYVHKGQELARFTNRELERKALEAESRGRSLREQREVVLQELAERSQDADTTQRLKRKKNDMDTEIQKLDKDLEILKPHIDTLTLRAPCDGWVINPPQPEEQGKFFDHTQPAPFCVIGDPQRLRMLVPVKPADYRLLKQDREALAGTDKDLPISIRIQGRDSCTWVGEWQVLPESEAKQIPLPLSNKGGGPISVKPPSGNDPNKLEPVDQQYMLSLTIKDPDKAVVPGSRGTVKIECRWRSAAWWVWRTVNDTFDLGLM